MEIEDISLLIGGLCVLILVGLAVYIYQQKKIEKSEYPDSAHRKDPLNFYGHFAQMLSKGSLTKRGYNRMHSKVTIICPTGAAAQENLVGSILFKSYALAVAVIIFVILMMLFSGFDVFYLGAGVLASFVAFKAFTTGGIRKLQNQLLYEEQQAFPKIHHKYHRKKMIDTAIRDASRQCGDVVRPHLMEIYDILTSANVRERAEEYVIKKPDNNLLMFLSFSTAVSESGDRTLPDGQSMFIKQLSYLKESVDTELLARRRQELAFKGTTAWTLGPLLLIKPFEMWVRSNVPEIAAYYDGIYATVCIMATFIVTYLLYTVIDVLQDTMDNTMQTDSIWKKIAEWPIVSDFLSLRVSRRYDKYLEIDSQLRGTGDHTGPKAFLMRRFGFMIIGFVMTLTVFLGGAYVGKSKLLTDFKKDFQDSLAPTPEYIATMEETAVIYSQHVTSNEEVMTKEEITEDLQKNYGYTSLYAEEIADAVVTHTQSYANRYFKWWQLLVAVCVGLIGFAIPGAMLKLNAPIIDSKRAEEVMNFEILMLILMNIPGTSVSDILDWMERFSTCFIESITTCHVNLGNGEEQAILDMQQAEPYPKFQEFCDCLLAIDDVGVADAFSEIESDHAYNREAQKIERINSIDSKARMAHFLSSIPLYMVIGLYLMIPLGMYALDMFNTFEGIM